MPSQPGPKISDWVSKLGIQDLFPPQRRNHHQSCPQVEELKEDVKTIVNKYWHMSVESIKTSDEIKDASSDLLRKYGPTIWSDKESRPWLFHPGEGAPGAPYERDRFFQSARDREFLESTLYEYVRSKVLRWHKDHYCREGLKRPSIMSETPDSAPDASYHPYPQTKPRVSNGGDGAGIRCFAHSLYNDHYDARRLDQLGIWLGDCDDEDRAINGRTQREVEKDYFVTTMGGSNCHGVEPFGFWDHLNRVAEDAICAACSKNRMEPDSRSLRVEPMDYEYSTNEYDAEVESKGVTTLQYQALIVRGTFHGRNVFAFVKELPEHECQRLGFNNKLWAFWRINGGYTTKTLLARKQDTTFPILRSDIAARATKKGLGKRKRSTTERDDADGQPGPSNWARSPMPHDAQENLVASIDRGMSFNSLYDVSPQPEAVHSARLSVDTVRSPSQPGDQFRAGLVPTPRTIAQAGSTTMPNECEAPAEEDATIPSPSNGLPFKIWFIFQANGTHMAEKAVRFSSLMTFEDAIIQMRSKLGRQLKGMDLLGITLHFDGKSSMLIDEEDMWDEVLQLVVDQGKAELRGVVDLE